MNRNKWLTSPAVGLAMIFFASCSPPPPPPAPLTAEELRIARQALALSDVSLMLRGGYTQDAIIADVQRRHVAEAPDAAAELNLTQFGATPKLIAALKAAENVLSPQQKEAFDAFRAEKTERVQQENHAQQQGLLAQQQQQEEDRQRRQQLAYQTAQNVRASEANEQATERQWAVHKAQKESLERQIVQVQTTINRKRSNGYRENELVYDVQLLERLNEQLKNLPTPQLR